MAWDLCLSGSAIAKAGVNANSTVINDVTIMEAWSDETEGYINAETRRDWIANPPSANTAGALEDVSSSHIANKIISYDIDAIGRATAETMINVNADIVRKGIAFLKQKENQEKM